MHLENPLGVISFQHRELKTNDENNNNNNIGYLFKDDQRYQQRVEQEKKR
jgi:hypothetical protein